MAYYGTGFDHQDGMGWFRVLGYGLHWRDHRRYRALFSERNGYTRSLHIGPWCLGVLKP